MPPTLAEQGRGSSSTLTRHVPVHVDQRNPSSVRGNSGRFGGASQAAVSLEQGPEQHLESGLRGIAASRLSRTLCGMPGEAGSVGHLHCRWMRSSSRSILW